MTEIIPLWRSSQFGSMAFNLGYNTKPATPAAWDILGESPLQMLVMAPPISSGGLDLLTVQNGPTLNPSAEIVLGILDSLTPAIKWGAMADLLGQDGEAQDVKRAAYCQQRYREFVEIARTMAVIIQAQINGVVCPTGAVVDADSFFTGWQTPPIGTQQPVSIIRRA